MSVGDAELYSQKERINFRVQRPLGKTWAISDNFVPSFLGTIVSFFLFFNFDQE